MTTSSRHSCEDFNDAHHHLKVAKKYGLPITEADRDAIKALTAQDKPSGFKDDGGYGGPGWHRPGRHPNKGHTAMTTMPTLSQLKAYDTDHVTAGIPHVTDVAQHSDSIFRKQDSDLNTMDGSGEWWRAATARVGGDAKLVSATSGHLNTVVSDIRSHASRLDQAHSDVMSYIGNIGKDYEVSENLTVTAKPASEPQFIQTVKAARAAQLTSDLGTKVTAFMAQETATRAMLSGHAATLGGVGVPDWKPPHYDDPNHGHYNENSPTPATPYEKAHNGSNFNDQVKLDTSMTSVKPDNGPEWLDSPPVKGDWPTPLLSQPPTGSAPPLPNPSNPFSDLSPKDFPPGFFPPVPPNPNVQKGLDDGLRHHPVNQPAPPTQTNGWAGGGHVQMVDNNASPIAPWDKPGDPMLNCSPLERQDELLKDLGRKTIAGAIIGGVVGGIPTEGIGAVPGMAAGAAGGALMWALTMPESGQGPCP